MDQVVFFALTITAYWVKLIAHAAYALNSR